ncbi:beta-lactamase/transpeptidase-like protein [Coniochaeta ligniaria NRRL 30616]|uniref:Beta-lactamase/transpeptidase-like protein n=1 Tax=Coniochaeta ligniaria NRRL 30616 TaxID=1408157 RepID=A0A1J7IAN6_9PEZI|nr:beta-lactamase/transpeptidase-like protein [Coniochaeta ligniaria NRRL 30616]
MLYLPYVLGALVASAVATALECHSQGPILPRPRHLAKSKVFQAALGDLAKSLEAAVTGEIKSGWDIRNVSLSVGVVTLDQPDPTTPAWEYHHLASGNVNGTQAIDKNSQYLIGSVSKVLSDAILLRSGVDIDVPITTYIPVLNTSSSLIDWNSITLRALASQLSDGFSEYYYLKDYFEYLGYPHLNDSAYADCGIIGLNGGCSKGDTELTKKTAQHVVSHSTLTPIPEFLKGMQSLYPVAPPMSRPVYSNIAFTLFVYALESHTGKSYAELVHELISVPLHMPNTFPSPGNDSLAVIPPVAHSWGSDYGDAAPGGGLVSTLADLTAFVAAILDRTVLGGPPERVREWLQPRSFAGSATSFVGMPWEIFRPPASLLFPGYNESSGTGGHTVTIYAKDGAAYGYRSRIGVLDEYGVGFVVLSAGDTNAVTVVADAVLAMLVPAVDAAAREEAIELGYSGSFVGESTPDTGSASFTATLELDGTSLVLKEMFRNGTDMLAAFQEVWAVTLGVFLPSLQSNGNPRLYPAELETKSGTVDDREVIREDWRIWFDVQLSVDSELPGKGISAYDCLSWQFADWLYYGSEPMDRVVFVKDAETGDVLGFEVPYLRSGVLDRGKGAPSKLAA